MYTYTHTYTYVSTCAYTHVDVSICIYMCIYMCIYTCRYPGPLCCYFHKMNRRAIYTFDSIDMEKCACGRYINRQTCMI